MRNPVPPLDRASVLHPAALRLGLAAALLATPAVLTAQAVAGGVGGWLAAAGMMLATALALRGLASYPHDRLGLCNLVTLVRAAMVAVLAALLVRPDGVAGDVTLAWAVVGLALAGLALDGADGWLARRSGLASAFGARFDMEVDAALAAVLCLLAIASGKAGLWLIPLGTLRYVWVAAGAVLPWLNGPLPDRFSRKAVCVVQIAALVALLAPVVVPPLSVLIAAGATAALLWSFTVDALWLRRRG